MTPDPIERLHQLARRQVSDLYRVNGRYLTPGTEFSVKGQRGRFRFLAYVQTDRGDWIDCYGGRQGYGAFRSFSPESVRTVHRTTKRR